MKRLLLLLLATIQPLTGAIITTDSLLDIDHELTEGALICFDIDETLIQPPNTFCTMKFWRFAKRYLNQRSPAADSIEELVFNTLGSMLKNAYFPPTEEHGPNFVRRLQDEGYHVMAITARSANAPWDAEFHRTTVSQLAKAGYGFADSAPALITAMMEPIFELPYYYRGIFFTAKQMKGPILRDLLFTLDALPTKVIMVDDKLEQLISIEESLQDLDIPLTCIRYSRLDERLANLDMQHGDIQLGAFLDSGAILSDEEAHQLKADRPLNETLNRLIHRYE